uniref:Reverse transcriptase domain-containing protein n=1 Tax=Tanacetum cinerariifolium TaxID=118510 RepID=A0A6L2N5I4_TANCI|nr:hypothetical protein [Tanacetum cinerariifolium]
MTKSEQNRTKSRANGKRGKVQTQAWQSKSPVKLKKASKIIGDKIICDLDKTPNFSQQSPQNCPKCGYPVNGHYCQGCAILHKKFKEDLFTSGIEHGILQDSSKPFSDNTNVVNAPREPFIRNQDLGKNSSQSLPQINHHCCYSCGDPLEGIFCRQCTCKLCGNGAHYGYNFPPKVPIIPNPEPFNNQTIKELPPTVQSLIPNLILFKILLTFSTHLRNFLSILVNSVGMMLVMVTIVRLKFRLSIRNRVTIKTLISRKIFNNKIFVVKITRLLMKLTSVNQRLKTIIMSKILAMILILLHMEQLTSMCDMVGKFIQKKEEEKKIEEDQSTNARYWKIPACYDDDDNDYNFVITPTKADNSLSMGDEHLDTISTTESNEFIKSSVENLVLIQSESMGEPACDMPVCEEFTTFLNILFESDYDFYSSDDQSFSDEDLPKEIYSNPLFDEEIIPIKIDQHHYNAESDLIESLRTYDSSIIISSKIDSLFDEFASELTLLKSILSRINETDCYPEEETYFTKRLLYDKSSPHPPKEFVSDNSDTEIESFSPSPIPVEDSDTLMKEIDLFFTPNYPMPPGVENDDYDSEKDILILKDLLSNDTLSLPENESFHFDIPSSSRPPAKPPDGHEAFQLSVNCPMMINGKNTPILDVPLFHFYPP